MWKSNRRGWLKQASILAAAASSGVPFGVRAGERDDSSPVAIGSRRELFVDGHLIDRLEGLRQELGQPQPAGIAIEYDQPWEGRFPLPLRISSMNRART
jgi:hypothetical protein